MKNEPVFVVLKRCLYLLYKHPQIFTTVDATVDRKTPTTPSIPRRQMDEETSEHAVPPGPALAGSDAVSTRDLVRMVSSRPLHLRR